MGFYYILKKKQKKKQWNVNKHCTTSIIFVGQQISIDFVLQFVKNFKVIYFCDRDHVVTKAFQDQSASLDAL